jgi:hypothetical protein
MIEIDKRSPKITRLRIIQLFEADYNMVLSTVFGKRMMRFAQKYCNPNENQYATPGKQCQSAVLNKVIMYDIMRLTRQRGASAEFDAVACFDHNIPALVVAACRRLGLDKNAGEMLRDSLTNTTHSVCTGHGESTSNFKDTPEHVLFGTGQGSGGSMPSWYAISNVIFDTIDSYGSSCVVSNPQKYITQSRTEDGFVDESSASVNGRDNRAEHRLQEMSQRHKKVLHATGGKMALHKCMWVMLE